MDTKEGKGGKLWRYSKALIAEIVEFMGTKAVECHSMSVNSNAKFCYCCK